MSISITIPGEPKGKARPRFGRKGDYVTTYTPADTVKYENFIKACFFSTCPGVPPTDNEIEVNIMAYFGIPKSASKKKTALMLNGFINPTKKPDADNIAKIILDSLKCNAISR